MTNELAKCDLELTSTWQDDRGVRFAASIASFLRTMSPNTRRSYRYAIEEFWMWFSWKQNATPTPDLVSRDDAASYIEHLRIRPEEFEEFKIVRMFGEAGKAVYDFVRSNPGSNLTSFPQETVSSMMQAHIIARKPTCEELRLESGSSDVVSALDVPPETFRYYVDARPEADQPSTILSRVSALSSLWQWLTETGENIAGKEQLITHNIWHPFLKRLHKQASSRKMVSRATKTPGWNLFLKILATTFAATHPSDPGRAAEDTWAGLETVDESGTEWPSLVDLRDRALLMLMAGCGLRADEIGHLKCSWLLQNGLLTVVGKGGRTRVVMVPRACQRAIRAYQKALVPLASRKPRRGQKRQLAGLLSPDAPLFPAVRLWGKNAPSTTEKGIGRSAIASVLRRRAKLAGVNRDSPEWAQVHAHGLRHLAAKEAIAAGVDLPTVQAALGHSSLSSTGVYTEQHDPEKICLVPERKGSSTPEDRNVEGVFRPDSGASTPESSS